MEPVVVVGAGISGVACTRELVAAGLPVRLVDRGRRIGGRLASRRLPDRSGRPVDLGASYLTADDPDFVAVVEDWRRRGLAHPWTDTFTVLEGGEPAGDKSGPLRWGAPGGLRSLVEDLAERLPVETGEVERVSQHRGEDGLRVDGVPAAAVVLAMPDDQGRRLLDTTLDEEAAALTRPSEPVIAMAAWWRERTWDRLAPGGRFHGAFVNGDDRLAFVADDGRRRGDDVPVLVAHSTPELAGQHLDDPAGAGVPMLAALRDRLGIAEEPDGLHVHRWSLARPTGTRESPYLLTDRLVGACGDGWGASPKVETAWLSGRALGRALVSRLG